MKSDDQQQEQNEQSEPLEMYQPTDDQDESELDSNSEDQDSAQDATDDNQTIHWSAVEYISRDKNSLWFVAFAVIVLGFVALDIFVLKTTFTFTALIIVMAIAIVVFNSRPPREIDYTLSPKHGLYIGEKLKSFSEFKSFGVINDDGNNFIMLVPTKRFSIGASVYFPEDVGEKIVDILGSRLPMEPLKLNAIDILVRKLHL